MDPISQGVLGAVVTKTFGHKSPSARQQSLEKTEAKGEPSLAKAAVIGALAAMAPDLDVLIRSNDDPLLALEYHRHFTHSLFFIPFGALLCSLVLHPLLGRMWRLPFTQTLIWCAMGYATHALLDACTTYGTQLLWPLANTRFAWDSVSVVDPLFTLPLLLLSALAIARRQRRWAQAAFVWVLLYLGLGFVQHERALSMGEALAESRGHAPVRLAVKPSFGNLWVWKLVYEQGDTFYVDALKPGLVSPRVWEGERVQKLNLTRDLPWLQSGSQQAEDIERFRWFSDDYLAIDARNVNRVVDIRYSMLPNEITALWGIELSPQAGMDEHVQYVTLRNEARADEQRSGAKGAGSMVALKQLWSMIIE